MIQKTAARLGFAAAVGVVAGVSFLTANEASAKGCNGVVSPMEWGCAAWDNNNGPEFPHYKKKASASQPARASAQPTVAPPKQSVAPNAGVGIISGGAGNAVPRNSSGIISGGAGNAVHK
jgi:hypothetical protein